MIGLAVVIGIGQLQIIVLQYGYGNALQRPAPRCSITRRGTAEAVTARCIVRAVVDRSILIGRQANVLWLIVDGLLCPFQDKEFLIAIDCTVWQRRTYWIERRAIGIG